jgi:ABC-type nitrate/sulfonate/bicarbonate transport system permease component
MADQPPISSADRLPEPPPPPLPGGTGPVDPWPSRLFRNLFTLRREISLWGAILLALLCVFLCFVLWWYVTLGEAPIVSRAVLASPAETFETFYPSLWIERELTRNTITTLRRVVLGFGLAVLIGLPLGVLCGCFPAVNAFFVPLNVFGRNIPIAALIPLMMSFFGIGEQQKVMFIFFASVAFIISDTARAINDVGSHYIDTAYTLGASRRQVILKVLVPLAMPSVFNSFRLLFGLAFGYIMLAETIRFADEAGGLGDIILTSARRGPREHIILILLIIPLVALAVDRLLFWVQRELFPYRYGGVGILNRGLRALGHAWESLKFLFLRPAVAPALPAAASRQRSASRDKA